MKTQPDQRRSRSHLSSRAEASPSTEPTHDHPSPNGTPHAGPEELTNSWRNGDVQKSSPAHSREPDLASGERPLGTVAPLTAKSPNVANHSVARAVFRKGSHFFLRSEEAYFLEEGAATVRVWNPATPHDVEAKTVVKGDFLPVSADKAHKLIADEECTCLILALPPLAF